MSEQNKQAVGQDNFPVSKQLLTPFQRKLLRKSLEEDLPKQYRQRVQIMLLADEGQSQSRICKALGCSQGTARYWISMAKAGQAHRWNDSPIGRPKTVNDEYLERLKELVTHSPRDYDYPFTRWTARWLSKHLAGELGIEISDRNVNLLLKKMGLSTRPKPATEKATEGVVTGGRIAIADLNSSISSYSELELSDSLTLS